MKYNSPYEIGVGDVVRHDVHGIGQLGLGGEGVYFGGNRHDVCVCYAKVPAPMHRPCHEKILLKINVLTFTAPHMSDRRAALRQSLPGRNFRRIRPSEFGAKP